MPDAEIQSPFAPENIRLFCSQMHSGISSPSRPYRFLSFRGTSASPGVPICRAPSRNYSKHRQRHDRQYSSPGRAIQYHKNKIARLRAIVNGRRPRSRSDFAGEKQQIRLADHKLANIPLFFSSKIFSLVMPAKAPCSASAAYRAEPSSPNLSVTRSALTPETVTELSPSA